MTVADRSTRCLVTALTSWLGAVIGGVIGTPGDRDEAHLARRLLGLLGPGMLLLADRAFDSATFLAEVDRTGAKLLVRGGSSRKPAVLRHLPDGSYLSYLAGLHVRIIEAELTVRGTDVAQMARASSANAAGSWWLGSMWVAMS